MVNMKESMWISLSCFIILSQFASAQNYTPEELSKLKLLDERTKAIRNKEFMQTNGYLMRFLRARNMDVDKASEMLHMAIKWRKDNKIDDLLNEQLIPEYTRNPHFTINGVDKEGSPVSITETKKLDVRKYVIAGMGRQISRLNLYVHEKMEDKIHEVAVSTGKNISQGFSILDVDGYNLRQHACIACISTYMEGTIAFERYYPGLYKRIIVINVPRITLSAFELAKPLMSSITLKTVNIYGPDKSQWGPKILEYVSKDQLPIQYGGTGQ